LSGVSRVFDVQMVAAIEAGQELCRAIRVAHCRVKVNYTVELTAAANPRVDPLADMFFLWSVEAIKERIAEEGVFEWRNGGADGADCVLVSLGDELAIAGDEVLRSHTFGSRNKGPREKDVIHSESDDHVFDAGLRKDVCLEARQARLT